MSDTLKDVKLKIERANTRIHDLNRRVIAFSQENSHEIFEQIDPDSQRKLLRARFCGTFLKGMDEIALDSAEAIYHLRSSLDQLTCSLAIANGATNSSETYFPFARDEDEFKGSGIQRKIKKLSNEAISMMAGLKPYKGGNDLLWALGRLANLDKHTRLIPIGHGISIGSFTIEPGPSARFDFNAGWQSLDKEPVLLDCPIGAKIHGDIKLSVDVAFDNVEPFECQPAIAILNQFRDLTSRIVGIFEERFFSSKN